MKNSSPLSVPCKSNLHLVHRKQRMRNTLVFPGNVFPELIKKPRLTCRMEPSFCWLLGWLPDPEFLHPAEYLRFVTCNPLFN